MLDALSPLGTPGDGVADAKGAIYLWAKLPRGEMLVRPRTRCSQSQLHAVPAAANEQGLIARRERGEFVHALHDKSSYNPAVPQGVRTTKRSYPGS